MNQTKLKGHTEFELRLAIRQERLALTRERIQLMAGVRRLYEIDERLAELEKTEYLMDNYG